MEQLIAAYPHSQHLDEVQFRRAEYFFTRKKYPRRRRRLRGDHRDGRRLRVLRARALQARLDALQAGAATTRRCTSTSRCSTTRSRSATTSTTQHDEDDERRIADTFASSASASRTSAARKSSSSTSRANGNAQLRGPHLPPPRRVLPREAALPRRRGSPTRRSSRCTRCTGRSPHFSMRVIEIYETGGFPKLVLESKKAFAANYGLQCRVLASLRRARVARGAELPEEQPAGPRESLPRAVPERGARGGEARELRRGGALVPRVPRLVPATTPRRRRSTTSWRTCCSRTGLRRGGARVRAHGLRLPEHERAAAAGYAAIYAHREHLKVVDGRRADGRRGATPSRARCASPTRSRSTSTPPPCWARRPTTCTR